MERLLGHAVHFAMLRRELLSIFRALYDFVHKSYHRRQRLWKSAAKEARWAQHLFKLCTVNMKRTWSSNTTTSDASLSGVAVCSRELATDVVQRHGRVRETWRYNSGSPVKPRNVVVEAGDPFRDPNIVKPLRPTRSDPYELNFDFPEVEEEIMKKEEWVNSFAIHMQHSEHITLLEGRGVVAALRHKFRSSKFFGQKHLHFTDNMSVVLLCSKGRSGNFGMLRVCRRLACLLLATDSFLQVRWVPSERNVADTASRQWESLRINALSTDSASTQKTSRGPISASGRLAAVPRQDPKEGAKAEGQAESRSLESREVGTATGGQSSKKGPEEIPEPILSGESGRLGAGGGRLPQKNAKLLPVSQGEQADTEDIAEQHEEIRRGLLQLHESHVRSRLRTARRNKIPSSRLRHVPRLWPQTCPSTDQEISARVDESGAPKDPSAFAVVTGGCAGDIYMLNNKCHAAAAAVLLCLRFTAYLRPGEVLHLQCQDLVPPMPRKQHWSLLLHPSERRERSKVGLADESILLNSSLLPWLGPAVRQLKTSSNYLIDITYYELVQSWQQALKGIGLAKDHAVLYQLRHSGPSHDRYHNLRPLAEVKQRGRWMADSTMRRYEAHARLNQEFHDLPKAIQKQCLQAEAILASLGPKSFGLKSPKRARAPGM